MVLIAAWARLLAFTIALLLALFLALGTNVTRAQDIVTIAAASDLKFALDEVIQNTPAARVRVTYGSSGVLFTQISQGAPFDLFMSADEAFVFQLAERGLARDRGELYAIGRLALFLPKGSPLRADAELNDLKVALTDGRLTRFAIANPEHAPYGRAAREALIAKNLWDPISPKLVLGENVSQAAQFAVSGAAQGGLIAHSLALAPSFAQRGTSVLIADSLHKPLRQRMVLTKRAGTSAEAFYRALQGPAARAVMAKYGFAFAKD